jgi:hypothetical protein
MLICENCGAEFMPSRSDAKWCSRLCQSYAWAKQLSAPEKHSRLMLHKKSLGSRPEPK